MVTDYTPLPWDETVEGFVQHLKGTSRAQKAVEFYQCLLSIVVHYAEDANTPLNKIGKRSLNEHNWLARQGSQKNLSFSQPDNTFLQIADIKRAQELSDAFPVERLHRHLDDVATQSCPAIGHFPESYHGSVMQVTNLARSNYLVRRLPSQCGCEDYIQSAKR